MKKYLMTGVAAIAICAAFTSCSKGGDELYDPDHESKVIAATYDEAFRNVFGNPAPTQEWGFGNNASTRTINVNGNMWKDCPEVGSKEETDVLAYLSTLQTKEKNPVRLQDYFVTQIHKGTQDYWTVGGGYVGVGSVKMNNLHFAMSSSVTINNGVLSAEGPTAWDHINNFNAGDCTDWSAGIDGKGNTMVLNGGTFDFAYQGSDDSKYHNRWCSIDGANVTRTDGKGTNYAGYYYICFDFEQDAPTKTVFYIEFQWTHEAGGGHMQTDNKSIEYKIDGSYDNDHKSDIVTAMGGKFTYEGKEYELTADMIRVANIEGANQNVNPNSDYKDWIVRLVKAERENEPPVEENEETDWIRVFGEDLNANNASDFDFNDIVIDIRITKTGAECVLQAAGGTMPLRINGDSNLEVHKLFGVATDVMVNTNAQNTPVPDDPTKMLKGENRPPVEFSLTGKFDGVKSVKIEVNKGGWKELTAERGVPASKIGTPKNTDWCTELYSIQKKYPLFIDWVTTNTNYVGVWK